ncbi:MAG: HD domain-containing protein [Erysipelotrichaceae bacterium]|nr:HD domain-containing protein [Erysipelotrichaceae bacterium]
MQMQRKQNEEEILSGIRAHRRVQEMKNYLQHGRISTYDHCENVVSLSRRIDSLLHLHSDPEVLLKGAMLHDFFLYDWHSDDNGTHPLHGFTHADRACRNARLYFHTGSRINHVIRCHMWPLNLTRVPASREAWIVCIADKIVSLHETLFCR